MNSHFFQKIPETGDYLEKEGQLYRVIIQQGKECTIINTSGQSLLYNLHFILLHFKVLSHQEVEEWKAKNI
jgi:hypothetical protein